jgi:uncharacterized protein
MPTFEDILFVPQEFSGIVRLFPLPNLVLFPHVMQPLHIFELRYRQLLEDALADDRLIAMALLEPGWETDYEGRPPIHQVACLGKITSVHKLADGTYNLLLLGLRRIRLLRELRSSARYRSAQVEICEDCSPIPSDARADLLRRLRRAFLRIIPSLLDAQEQLDQLLGSDVSLAVLTDALGYILDLTLLDKQALLAEANVLRRAEMLLAHLEAAAEEEPAGLARAVGLPPLFSAN